MEIKVGEYIRTENGIIGKVFDEDSIGKNGVCIDTTYLDEWGDETDFVKYENIKKHSFNIIDLIELGDYVNGCEVVPILGYDKDGNDIDEVGILKLHDDNDVGLFYLAEVTIKSIVTKELFKLEEYIV